MLETDSWSMVRTLFSSLHPRRPLASRWATSRPGSWLAGTVAAAVAAAYFAYAYAVVFVMRIGPTSVTISEANGWGLHTGDVLALPLAVMGLLSLAFAVSCFAPQPRPALVVRPLDRR